MSSSSEYDSSSEVHSDSQIENHSSSHRSKPKRKNQAPVELSSRKRPSRVREALFDPSLKRKKSRDPRFDPLCGDFDARLFNEEYSFVDDNRAKEIQELELKRKKLKAGTVAYRAVTETLGNLKGEQSRRLRERDTIAVLTEHKRSQMDRPDGKRSYLKRSQVHRLVMEKEKSRLQEQGTYDKALKKREKRRISSEKRRLPRKIHER
ncbi:hypothetical protein P9112_005534 [Eukaryota sp. TZLM1-RC]